MKKILSILLISLMLFLAGCKKDNKIDITFMSNEDIIEVKTIEAGSNLLPPEEIIREGYKFDGWFFDTAFNSPYDISHTFFESVTLYAKWIANTYEVKFYSVGGSAIRSVKVEHGQVLSIPNESIKKGYIFKGWYLDSEYKSSYDFTKAVTFKFDLYAKWEEILLDLVELDDYNVNYIVTTPGEDSSSSFLINYQAKNIKTKIEYTTATDVEFKNAIIAYPEMKAFEMLGEQMEKAFERRNVCKVTLTGLDPNSDYMYRINNGDNTYSDLYHFSTSGNDSKTSFLFMTDIHYYDTGDGAEVSETVISKALEIQPNIKFLFTTGDIIDTGGNSDDWEKLFTKAQSFKNLPYVGVPGNHEHYEKGPMMGEMQNKVYVNYFHNPRNGIEVYKGVSYYFIHNDTLFIQIDTDSPYNQGEQLIWLENVLKDNPTKFVIVGTHAPVNEAGSDYNRPFMEVLEKYGVDLMLAGHYHNEVFKTLYLDEKPYNDQIGVTYFRGAGGGAKAVGDVDPEEFAKGYIIDVLDDSIQIRYINAKGTVYKTSIIKNNKLSEKETATKAELISSVQATFNKENQSVIFDWSSKFYKNVKHMKVTEVYRDQRSCEFIFPTPGYVRYGFDKVIEGYDNKFIFDITFADDSKHQLVFEQLREGRMGLVTKNITATSVDIEIAVPNASDLKILRNYIIYANNKQVGSFDASDFTSGKAINEYTLEGLTANTEYHIVIEAHSRYGVLYIDETNIKTKTN